MRNTYAYEIRKLFVDKFKAGVYNEKELHIWLENQLNMNNSELICVLNFLVAVGGGALVAILISTYVNQLDIAVILGTCVLVLITAVSLVYFVLRKKAEIYRTPTFFFELFYSIKSEIQRLELIEENKNLKQKARRVI
jgi:uncharacterized membrane protein YobD (UPF0266 family)